MSERPNILLVMADQFRFDCLSSLGHGHVRTPTLDRLADEGVHFTGAYCATMACGPARASMFSGLYQDRHGMVGNKGRFDPPDTPVLPEYLQQAGYDTALVGKLHLHPFQRRFGFRHFRRHDAPCTNYMPLEAEESAYLDFLKHTAFADNPDEPVRLFTEDEAAQHTDELRFMLGGCFVDEAHHETTWAVDESMDYLRNHRLPEQPFFLNLSFYGPHQPYLCPGRWATLVPPESIELPRRFDVSIEGKPLLAGSRHAEWVQRRTRLGWDDHTYRRILSAYYGYVSMIDHHLGRLVEVLHELDLYDNTLIVFTSDHGEYLGQFRFFYKGHPYEGATHIPMIVRHPGAAIRGRCDRHVSNLDVFATCLTAAGGTVPEDLDSRDMTPVLQGRTDAWDNRVYFKNRRESMVVRDGWKLMRGELDGTIVRELYNLRDDPLEQTNLYGAPHAPAHTAGLVEELDRFHARQEAFAREHPNARRHE